MGIARNIARLIPNGSGLLPNANIEAVAASKLTGSVALATQVSGTLPDANAPSGSILQVVQATQTTTTTYSVAQSWISMSSFLSESITPISSSNRILIMLQLGKVHNINGVIIRLTRAGSVITGALGQAAGSRPQATIANVSGFNADTNHSDGVNITYIDSPATTSSTTYSFDAYSEGSGVTGFNRSISDGDNTQEYSARVMSSIILMEIAS